MRGSWRCGMCGAMHPLGMTHSQCMGTEKGRQETRDVVRVIKEEPKWRPSDQ